MSGHRVELMRDDPEGTTEVQLVCEEAEGAICRFQCDACESWTLCQNCPDDGHPDIPHDIYGHTLRATDCAAVDYIHGWSCPEDAGPWVIDRPGPVGVEWTGDDWIWYYLAAPSPGEQQ